MWYAKSIDGENGDPIFWRFSLALFTFTSSTNSFFLLVHSAKHGFLRCVYYAAQFKCRKEEAVNFVFYYYLFFFILFKIEYSNNIRFRFFLYIVTAILDEGCANVDRVASARKRLQKDQIRWSLRIRFHRPDRLFVPDDSGRHGNLVVDLRCVTIKKK